MRSGSIKNYLVDEDGVEQVTGFYLPGEVLGFDGIGAASMAVMWLRWKLLRFVKCLLIAWKN